jgi:DNA-binding MarR family transcriptional regulator
MKPRRAPTEFMETFGTLKKAISTFATQLYAHEGLGPTQVLFLRQIGKQSGISQAELARATSTDPALTGRVLQTLVDRGWVRRQRSEIDRRGYVLELGAAGHRTVERLEKVRARTVTRFTAALDARDLEDFERITKKLLASLAATKAKR